MRNIIIVTLFLIACSFVAIAFISCATTRPMVRPTLTTAPPVLTGGCLVSMEPAQIVLSCDLQEGIRADITVPLRGVTLRKIMKVMGK